MIVVVVVTPVRVSVLRVKSSDGNLRCVTSSGVDGKFAGDELFMELSKRDGSITTMECFNNRFVLISKSVKNYISEILCIERISKEGKSISFHFGLLHILVNGVGAFDDVFELVSELFDVSPSQICIYLSMVLVPLTLCLSWFQSCLTCPLVGFAYFEGSNMF